MPFEAAAARPLATERCPWLRGRLAVPGDEMISHLALALGALARGETTIKGALRGPRTAAMGAALTALGVRVDDDATRRWLHGLGVRGLLRPEEPLDLASSPIGLLLTIGLVAPLGASWRITGDPVLFGRPLNALLDPLAAFGMKTVGWRGSLPLTLEGPAIPMPVESSLPPGEPMIKAALLLAALNTPGISTFTDPHPTPNHAERLLAAFGADIVVSVGAVGEELIRVRGLTELTGRTVAVPGDTALAALGAVAASIVPGSEITVPGVLVNPRRTAVLSALVALGADIEVHALRIENGEEVADLVVRHRGLTGIRLAAAHVGPLLDAVPMLAVAAACAEGETVFELPPNLPMLTYARHEALAKGLRANGIAASAGDDAIVVKGGTVAGGGRVVTDDDGGLAMAFLVLGMAAADQVTIDDQTGIEERFPDFVSAFEQIGASFIRYTD
jgi:3-phosphoshikimate 1-carboxyvinyltransferase